jgi:hypothetical protein
VNSAAFDFLQAPTGPEKSAVAFYKTSSEPSTCKSAGNPAATCFFDTEKNNEASQNQAGIERKSKACCSDTAGTETQNEACRASEAETESKARLDRRADKRRKDKGRGSESARVASKNERCETDACCGARPPLPSESSAKASRYRPPLLRRLRSLIA